MRTGRRDSCAHPDFTQSSALTADVTAAVEREVEEGHRATQIDAHDLVEVLLAIADRLDPPGGRDA
jgi:hypothetical protein